MCGIYGSTERLSPEIVIKKLSRIQFRGPDNQGYKYYDKLVLGHNRLSIIDLDERSHQPFEYQGSIALVYNGELYNFQEIKSQLKDLGYVFRTTSDTEVICASYLEHGTDCLQKFNGMFAFVLYDKRNDLLFGARDRTGQKPLYYTTKNGHFEFASQPSQIAIDNSLSINERAVSQYFKWLYISEPYSIYKEVNKLRAGHYFTYNLSEKTFRESQFWDLPKNGPDPNIQYSEAKSYLTNLLRDSVKKRMISDVPLGVFLSGGIDSSLITALATKESSEQVRTFSVKFDEAQFDESVYAKQVASHLGTKHTEIHCNYDEAISLIENLHYYYDEPFADSSAIPSLLLAKHTRQDVTVALTGDAGDETFLGYKRYDKILEWLKFAKLPLFIRKGLAGYSAVSKHRKHRIVRPRCFLADDINQIFYMKRGLIDDVWLADPSLAENREHYEYLTSSKCLLERASDYDIKTYLVENGNTKVDRATMAYSLEARSPFLDHRVIEYSRRIPTSFKYNQGEKKYILKEILYDFVPKEIFQRKKWGFQIPVEHWFRKSLKTYVLDTLTSKNLKEVPNLNINKVLELTDRHIQGIEDNHNMIWNLIVYINWMNHRD